MTHPRFWLIVPAAGIGQRMQSECPKQYLRIDHRFILDITLSRTLDAAPFAGCVVALHPDDRWWPSTAASTNPRVQSCLGGSERADSVLAALAVLAGQAADDDWVLVHDAARPCLHRDDLARLMAGLRDHRVGGLLAARVADTIKRGDASHPPQVLETVDRSDLWRALTPQMFRYSTLVAALEHALRAGHPITDESSAVEFSGNIPELVEGRPDNIKITVPADLALASFILSQF
ncbi:MAG: 2-C-methyl-D-erythritol 4-phosphate cytidylyltransferase [Marinobacter sp.]|uniref:2-C-methyl-D-erythritol 4-phosphate cytidylyltransferase n=1 Tax=Marinobacter sp. TaxID=50741 RepID=UPI003C627632